MGAAGIPGQLTLPEWLNRSSDLVRLTFTDPLFLLNLKQNDGSANVLANPRIRVKNKEKARVHIGDRVPVITTTAAATGGFVSESVSYLDIGLKLEVEPLIFLEDEVGIKVGLEVSNIVKEIRSVGSNSLNYQIGTRNAATVLRLKDGETQVLAGLISREDRRSADRVPGLGELPVVGRLFSNTNDTRNRTEIMLLITPHLARALIRPDASSVEFAAGTEASTGVPRLGGAPLAPILAEPQPQGPATDTSGAPVIPQQQQPPHGRHARALRRSQANAAMSATTRVSLASRGFTLIELVITVAIIAVLASVALPLNELIVTRAKEQDLRRSLREIRDGIDAYKQAWDDGRLTKSPNETGYPKNLDDLVKGVEDQKSPKRDKIYFMRRIPRDPFTTSETLTNAETWGKRAYQSPPDDPKEGEDVFDVFSLATGTGINGRPYKEW